MSCSPFDLRDYFFGELAREEHASVEAHVKACAHCREELESLRLLEGTLLSVREEEPPRRIAFVSDKIFEPTWWQRLWRSGPQLGFASAGMLAGAIVLHGWMARPAASPSPQVAVTAPASGTGQRLTPGEVSEIVRAAVKESEDRQAVRFQQVLEEKQKDWDLQQRANLVAMEEVFSVMQKRMNVLVRASNDAAYQPAGNVQ
jgi:anti-sigma factor RsiW